LNDTVLTYSYKFELENGIEKTFVVNLKENSLEYLPPEELKFPKWALLSNFRCGNCPLSEAESKYCPLAVNLAEIISFFSDVASFEKARITVGSPERTYYKHTSVQSGISGLIGILMVTGGCPVMAKLKPMVRFHLPFATIEETEYRVFSFYLLSQLVRKELGGEPDWELNGLHKMYREIEEVNKNVVEKIRSLSKKDAGINSIIVLNNFANFVTIKLDEKDIEYFENLFKDLLD